MLRDVAFGPDPGRCPLPGTGDPEERWLRAVAYGGQGRYARARAELARAASPGVSPALASLAASTRASLLRQLGSHAVASGYDGAALALVGRSRSADPADDGLLHEARCDALTGLAADALGCGRLTAAHRLLSRCRDYLSEVDDAHRLWRQHVRLDWVRAEVALASGDFGTATARAQAAVDRSAECPSVRHRVKSALLLAAAATGRPDSDLAVQTAERVLADSCEHGLLPLQWAAAMLLDGIRPSAAVREVRDECARTIVQRGGRFTI
ncbi:hypothetical protein [Rhodococcus sp. SGAir0479]|uniref:hypothetical protein n=1 Tax=Rhodococcus sp. SGAir0479 TaxID=2567884 RepID=UPI0010CCBB22|nr:hypothetical protein [Rhodococcus sp. SGAir0479]QCQ92122.1 hypothetical protein E7742_13445 [Rhodococcus sp. SGAir0479]